MRPITPTLFAVIALWTFVSVSASCQQKKFRPLNGNEIFTSSVTIDRTRDDLAISIYASEGDSARFIAVIEPAEGRAILADSSKKAFVAESRDRFVRIWYLDGNAGVMRELPIAYSSLLPSRDGNFVCFVDVKYMDKASYEFPRVKIYDVKNDKVVAVRDFTARKFSWTEPAFTYEPAKRRFKLDFYAEKDLMATEYMSVPDN